MSTQVSRLQEIEAIEKDIAAALQSAGQALTELSKEKLSLKQIESHTTAFLKTLNGVESALTKHINYLTQVSTGQPHEGSSYAAQKDLQMAFHRMEHVRTRLSELERMKSEHLNVRPGVQRSQSAIDTTQRGQGSTDNAQRHFVAPDPSAFTGVQRSFSQPEAGGMR